MTVSLLARAQEAHEEVKANEKVLNDYNDYIAKRNKRALLTNSCIHDIVNGIMFNGALGSLLLTTSDLLTNGLRTAACVTIPMWILSAILAGKIFLDIVVPVSEENTFIGKRELKPCLILGSQFGFTVSTIIIGEMLHLSPFYAKPLLVQASVLFPSVLIGSIVGVICIRQFMKSS